MTLNPAVQPRETGHSDSPLPNPPFAAVLRIHLSYLWQHRRLLSLNAPTRLTELVQRRKLFDRDERLPQLIDKLGAKHFVAERLGPEWVTSTLWTGSLLPATPPWPRPFVVKSRHGCNQRRFVRSGEEDWAAIRKAAARWMRREYGFWLDEWGYRGIPRGLLVEPFIGEDLVLPLDYKVFVFHGHAAFIQVHLGREDNHRWLVFDRNWRRVSRRTEDPDPEPPVSLARMIDGAEILGRGFDFVRVDFYEIAGQPRFGELTFYPGSGLESVDPPELDEAMGSLWLGRFRPT